MATNLQKENESDMVSNLIRIHFNLLNSNIFCVIRPGEALRFNFTGVNIDFQERYKYSNFSSISFLAVAKYLYWLRRSF